MKKIKQKKNRNPVLMAASKLQNKIVPDKKKKNTKKKINKDDILKSLDEK